MTRYEAMSELARLNDEQATLLRQKANLLNQMANNIREERDLMDIDEALEVMPS